MHWFVSIHSLIDLDVMYYTVPCGMHNIVQNVCSDILYNPMT